MFLQAAGMAYQTVRPIADSGDIDGLFGQQRILAELARKVSVTPVSFAYTDTVESRRVLSDDKAFLEAAMVIAGFNFANRCADALGVRTEVPAAFDRWPNLHWVTMRLLSWAIRLRTDFRNRPVAARSADQILWDLENDMRAANMGPIPSFFEFLRPRPDLMAVQATATRAALLGNQLSRRTNLSVAYVICSINGDTPWQESCAVGLREEGLDPSSLDAFGHGDPNATHDLANLEAAIVRFAIDITLHAERTTTDQIDTLRTLGMTDGMILDLVAISAAVNAGNRLNQMLVPPKLQDSVVRPSQIIVELQ